MRKLFDANVLRKYTAIIDVARLGHSWYTYAIQFSSFDARDEAKLQEYVRQHSHIIRGVKTLGAWNVLLEIVADNPVDYHRTVKEIKNMFASTIRKYESWLAFHEYVFNPLPSIIVDK